jgi:hypothetical protein
MKGEVMNKLKCLVLVLTIVSSFFCIETTKNKDEKKSCEKYPLYTLVGLLGYSGFNDPNMAPEEKGAYRILSLYGLVGENYCKGLD